MSAVCRTDAWAEPDRSVSGRVEGNKKRFSNGIAALAEYVHAKGISEPHHDGVSECLHDRVKAEEGVARLVQVSNLEFTPMPALTPASASPEAGVMKKQMLPPLPSGE